MTKHELARRIARQAGKPGLKQDALRRRRKSWLAKQHRKAIKIALAMKEKDTMRQTFLAAALAVAACVGFTTPAAAQDFPVAQQVAAVKQDVAALKAEVATLKRQLADLTGVSAFPAACPCGDSCPCATKAASAAPLVCTPAGCFPAGAAAASPTYSAAPPLTYTATPVSYTAAGSPCVGGNCAAPGRTYLIQPFGGRFRR